MRDDVGEGRSAAGSGRSDSVGGSGNGYKSVRGSSVLRLPGIDGGRRGVRVALYSHDTMGLGHVRRNLVIARTLVSADPQANVLMIAGAGEAGVFRMPPRVDCVTLPALCKGRAGDYRARSLDFSLEEIRALRAPMIRTAVESFAPDVLVVDNVPRGAVGELEPTLEFLRQHDDAHCVLGLRDILDSPEVIDKEWSKRANEKAIDDYYDAIWVYGDRAVFDPVREYGWNANIAQKVSYTGYLDRRDDAWRSESATDESFNLPPGKLVLCMAGGGQDGDGLMQAMSQVSLPPDTGCVIVTGPFMADSVRRTLADRAARDPNLVILEFLPEPLRLLERADKVIAMGGYNTVSEILSFGKPALIVPRVAPRQEQFIRARRLEQLGLVDMLHPDELCPGALLAWITHGCRRAGSGTVQIDFDGLSRLPRFLDDLIGTPRISRHGRRMVATMAESPARAAAAPVLRNGMLG